MQLDSYLMSWVLFFAGTPVVIAFSYVFYILFERPVLLLGNKMKDKNAAAL